MRHAGMFSIILILLFTIRPHRLPAQEKSVWELTHSRPATTVGDTTVQKRQIQFYNSKRDFADLVDGAGGSHYAVWGDIHVADGDYHALWASADSGHTWNEVLRSPIPVSPFHDISVPEPNHLSVLATDLSVLATDGSISQLGKVFHSEDGGKSWKETVLPRSDAYTSQGQIAMADALHGIAFISTKRGFFRTTDGWKTVERIDNHPGINARDVFCPEPDVYILTGTLAYRTTDGGVTWTTAPANPFPDSGPMQFSFVDRNYGWAITNEPTGVGHLQRSRISRTTDGGVSWTELYNGEEILNGGGLLSIDFADRLNGLVGGRGGIYRTTDGGESWTPEDLPSDEIGSNPFASYLANPAPGFGVALLSNNSIITAADKTTLPAPVITHPATTVYDSRDTLTLSWSPVPNATSYQIQMARREKFDLSADFYASIVVDEGDITATSKVFQLEYGDWFYLFQVRAMNDHDTSRWSARRSVGTLSNAGAPGTPRFILPALNAQDVPTTVPLVWNSSSGATRYHLQVSTFPLNSGGILPIVDTPSITDTSFMLSGLEPYTKYYCGVKAYNDLGASDWSWAILPHQFETGRTSGVRDNRNEATSIDILPNPARNSATLSFPLSAVMIGLFDTNGKLVLTSSTEGTVGPDDRRILNLDLSNLAAGMYIVKIRAGEQIKTERLLVLP